MIAQLTEEALDLGRGRAVAAAGLVGEDGGAEIAEQRVRVSLGLQLLDLRLALLHALLGLLGQLGRLLFHLVHQAHVAALLNATGR